MTLSARQNYGITKKKDMAAADVNRDGVVNLKSEMNYAHAYYAAGFDKGGLTDYYNTRSMKSQKKIWTSANKCTIYPPRNTNEDERPAKTSSMRLTTKDSMFSTWKGK